MKGILIMALGDFNTFTPSYVSSIAIGLHRRLCSGLIRNIAHDFCIQGPIFYCFQWPILYNGLSQYSVK